MIDLAVRNQDWIKTLSWDLWVDDYSKKVTTLAELLDFMEISDKTPEEQRVAIQKFMDLPATEPMPEELRNEIGVYLGQKFNPYHDEEGRFSSASGGSGGAGAVLRPGKVELGTEDEFITRGEDVSAGDVRVNAKRRLNKALFDRLISDPEALAALHKIPRHPGLKDAIKQRIDDWAGTASDNDPKAIAMQMAAKEEFGLTDADPFIRAEGKFAGFSAPKTPMSTIDAAKAEYSQTGAFDRKFLRAMYEYTQEELSKANITEVSLIRGLVFKQKDLPTEIKSVLTSDKGHPDIEYGQRIFVHRGVTKAPPTLPITSWTSDAFTAREFATATVRNLGVELRAVVPASRILGTARTGFGALNESEYIALDTSGDVHTTINEAMA